jgi:hypothetical protein
VLAKEGKAMDKAATLPCLKRWAAVVVIVALPGCAIAEKIDKASNPPDLTEVWLREQMKEPGESLGRGTSLSRLRAIPAAVDFGQVQVASDNQRQLAISNPSEFEVTIIHATIQGCGFALLAGGDQRQVVAAKSQLVFAVAFRPMDRRTCSGTLILEIDSAGGRLTRVPLTGTGI